MARDAAGPRPRLIRNVDAGSYLESFLVAAVAAVLVIRFSLELTGYPQLGGHGLHIAHMLWGGLLMLVAIVLLLAYLGRHLHHLAAIVAGIGFGTFIDELGKFITSDNDYFFQPTIALIYAIFILLFLAFRAVERRQEYTAQERLANGLDLLREALLDPRAVDQRARALALLASSRGDDPLVRQLRDALAQSEAPPPEGSRWSRGVGRGVDAARSARQLYRRIIAQPWFHRAIVGGFLLHALIAIGAAVGLVVNDPRFTVTNPAMDLPDWGDTIATVLSTGCVLVGAARLRYSRLEAYYWFKRSILVSIFLIQFFAFYTQQLGAIVGLAIDLVILAGLDYMLGAERADGDSSAGASLPGAGEHNRAGGAAAPG